MSQQNLHSAQVAGSFVNQGCLCAPQRVGAIILPQQADGYHPFVDQTRILAGAKMAAVIDTAREGEIVETAAAALKPGQQRGPRWFLRLPAHEIEALVVNRLADWLDAEACDAHASDAAALNTLRQQRSELAHALRQGNQIAQRAILLDLGVTVAVGNEQVEIRIDSSDLAAATTITMAANLVDRGSDLRMVIAVDGSSAHATPDPVLLKLIVLTFAAREAAISGKPEPLVDHYSRQHQTRLARLSYLAPDIVGAVLDGRQPPELNGRRLLRIADLPLDWGTQRRRLGVA